MSDDRASVGSRGPDGFDVREHEPDTHLPDADAALFARAFPDATERAARAREEGLFPADSAIRRLSAENAVVMGGACALLLEVAHPLVAAGVARHSQFRTDPFGRLQRTLDAISSIVFADRARAFAAARQVERGHAGVEGRLGFAVPGRFPADARYSGRAAPLLLWVWATLVWTTLHVHERFVAPVASADRMAFHRDHAAVARLLGVPAACVPGTPEHFEAYFEGVLARDLQVTREAREIADSVLDPPQPLPGGKLVRALTTVLLPQALRDAYGLSWGSEDESRLARFEASVRGLRERARS